MTFLENHQWAVTDYGLESVEPSAPYGYYIEARRLLEMWGAGEGQLYDWPIHMAGKDWVDLGAFLEAYKKGLEVHADRYDGEVDSTLLEASIRRARQVATT